MIRFHERVGLEARRISPFSWRIRYALAHKNLQPEIIETRFADVDRIRALSGQHMVPIIEDDGKVIHDSWAIACHLEDQYPDRPSLFGGPIGKATTKLISNWTSTTLGPVLRVQVYGDFLNVLDPGDRAYFRQSREAQLGMTLEQYGANRDKALPELLQACLPLDQTLSEQDFLAGDSPAYVDYLVFSLFQYARIGSPRDALAATSSLHAVRAWRTRMIALFGGLGDEFAQYPTNTYPTSQSPPQPKMEIE